MPDPVTLLIALLFFLAALLYASVGHGGASAYLAVMALLGVAPAVMKPTALVLNILVSGIGTVLFYRAGSFSWRTFWPFALGSAPLAFAGGLLTLPMDWYRPVVGLVLLYAAWRLWPRAASLPLERALPRGLALGLGMGIGFLSGLTGVGGGIFLSPLLLLARWADPRQTAGVSAAFILVNSVAGLLGHLADAAALPPMLPWWATAAGVGGLAGAWWGSHRLPPTSLRRLLALVLVVAALKMLLA
jgi:hypothetical protein